MLSLLGAGLGFFTSIVPDILGFFKQKQADKHELAMMDKMTERAVQESEAKLQMIDETMSGEEANTARNAEAKVAVKADKWVTNLSGTVRPVITYAFFIEIMVLTLAVFNGWIDKEQYQMVWNHEMQAVWAAVVSFWFGSRELRKRTGAV